MLILVVVLWLNIEVFWVSKRATRLDSYGEAVVFVFYILNLNESILQILMNQLLVSLMTRRDAETPPSDQWLFTRGRGFLMSDVIISPRALTTSRAGHHLSRPTPRSPAFLQMSKAKPETAAAAPSV